MRHSAVLGWHGKPHTTDRVTTPIRRSARVNAMVPIRPECVVGPLGEPLTLDRLPPPDTRRWVARRKAEVVAAVAGGLLSIDEACERYGLSIEEFTAWQRAVERSGMAGLRVTRTQLYRELYERQQKY